MLLNILEYTRQPPQQRLYNPKHQQCQDRNLGIKGVGLGLGGSGSVHLLYHKLGLNCTNILLSSENQLIQQNCLKEKAESILQSLLLPYISIHVS